MKKLVSAMERHRQQRSNPDNIVPMGPEGAWDMSNDDLQSMTSGPDESSPEPPVRELVLANLSDDVRKLEEYEQRMAERRDTIAQELSETEALIAEARTLLRHLVPTQKCVAEFCKAEDKSCDIHDIAAVITPKTEEEDG